MDDRGLTFKEISGIIFWMGSLAGLSGYIGPPVAYMTAVIFWIIAGLLWLAHKEDTDILKKDKDSWF